MLCFLWQHCSLDSIVMNSWLSQDRGGGLITHPKYIQGWGMILGNRGILGQGGEGGVDHPSLVHPEMGCLPILGVVSRGQTHTEGRVWSSYNDTLVLRSQHRHTYQVSRLRRESHASALNLTLSRFNVTFSRLGSILRHH